MLLIDVVLMGAAQNLLLKSKISEGKLLLHAVALQLAGPAPGPPGKHIENIEALLDTSGFACAVILDRDTNAFYTAGQTGVPHQKLLYAARSALNSGHLNTELTGSTWGVFWRQRANLLLSTPVYQNDTRIAGVCIVMHLQEIYRPLRHAQHLAFAYILFNLIVLTFIGRYRFSRSTIIPIQKLMETADAYKDGNTTLLFGAEKEGNEFTQLSNALNQMLHRISDDQKNLRRTVQSLKQANADLQKAQNDIINAEKLASVGRLSAGIAHEIGNPIAIIMGYLELLKRKDISTLDHEDFIARTESEILRINQIIRQLLDFSRPSNNAVGKIFIHDILSEISTIFQYQPLMKDVHFELSLKAVENGVNGDAALLRQAFFNIVINAADAVHQNGRPGELVVETRNPMENGMDATSGCLEIVFRDNGAGIPKDQLHYIFDPFYTTKAPGKGTGLGLSVCYMIIEASGGRITAQSEEGIGTTMIIELPLCAGQDNRKRSLNA